MAYVNHARQEAGRLVTTAPERCILDSRGKRGICDVMPTHLGLANERTRLAGVRWVLGRCAHARRGMPLISWTDADTEKARVQSHYVTMRHCGFSHLQFCLHRLSSQFYSPLPGFFFSSRNVNS